MTSIKNIEKTEKYPEITLKDLEKVIYNLNKQGKITKFEVFIKGKGNGFIKLIINN